MAMKKLNEAQKNSIEKCLAAGHVAPFYVHGLKVCSVEHLPYSGEFITIKDVVTGVMQSYTTESPDMPEDSVEIIGAYLDEENLSLPDGYKLISKEPGFQKIGRAHV